MNVYDTNLTYALNDMLTRGFEFTSLFEIIRETLEDSELTPQEVIISLIIIPPSIESEIIEESLDNGKLKSFQKKEACEKIFDLLRGALNTNLAQSLNRFLKLKDNITIKIKNNARKFHISLHFRNLRLIPIEVIIALLNHFNVDVLGYCDEIEVEITMIQKGANLMEPIYHSILYPIPLSQTSHFLCLDDKEEVLNFYSHPDVKDILFHYFFPFGLKEDTRTEITLDTLQEGIMAQKRRKILLSSGEYENFHDTITPYTTHQEFRDIIDTNNILGFYASVRTTKEEEIATAVIDIDVSGFLRTTFPASILWELVLTLTEELIETLTHKCKLPVPLVVFSGNRGVHILYRIAPESVNDRLGYLNFPELFLLPSQKELSKNKSSLLHNKFIFIKTLMQAILLYTVENLPLSKIPKRIRTVLGITNVMDLFTLSIFSHNKVGILLDTSSNNSSVHRVFSLHPTTGLVTIPLLDPITNQIREECRTAVQLKEEASPKTVVENLNSGNKAIYYQFPPIINHAHISFILRPDVLLPTLSVIVRFSDRWITERNVWSYSFWLQMYELNNFYDYILANVMAVEKTKDTVGELYQKIKGIINNSSVHSRKYVRKVVDMYFFQNISYKSLKSKLDAFRDLEFFSRFKKEELKPLSSHQLERLFNDSQLRKFYFRKFISFLNIVLVLLGFYFPKMNHIKLEVKTALLSFHTRLKLLQEFLTAITIKDQNSNLGHLKLQFAQISCLYNYIIVFLNDLFQFTTFHE